jgi:Uma2 family endonuclease
MAKRSCLLVSLNAARWNIWVRPELRVRTGKRQFRAPDVTILDASLPREPIATHPPQAVFEILSPEDTHKRLMQKLHDYEEMGIPSIWVLNPECGVFEQFREGGLHRGQEFSLEERGIVFSFEEIAQLVD